MLYFISVHLNIYIKILFDLLSTLNIQINYGVFNLLMDKK